MLNKNDLFRESTILQNRLLQFSLMFCHCDFQGLPTKMQNNEQLKCRIINSRRILLNPYFLDDIEAFDDFTENHVFVIEPIGFRGSDKKLTAVRIRAGVGHRKDAGFGVFQLEIFVVEFIAVYRFATSAIMIGEITTLTHKSWNHSMESTPFIPESLFSGAKSPEIFRSFRNYVFPQLEKFEKIRLKNYIRMQIPAQRLWVARYSCMQIDHVLHVNDEFGKNKFIFGSNLLHDTTRQHKEEKNCSSLNITASIKLIFLLNVRQDILIKAVPLNSTIHNPTLDAFKIISMNRQFYEISTR